MRVLSDTIIKQYLKSLTKDDILRYQSVLVSALKSFSADPSLIPHRIVTRTSLATHLFMPALGETVGVKALTGSASGFNGVTMILDPLDGSLLGVLNAKTLTAFRTALASTLALVKFFKTLESDKNQCIVYGTGLQAYWHVRLTLKLYPGLINKVVIANRSLQSLEILQENLSKEFPDVEFSIVTYGDSEKCAFETDKSSIIFGCTPSTSPNIHYKWLTTSKRRYISLIGSYQPHMSEIDAEFVNAALSQTGKIVVDSVEHVAIEAGEIIKNSVSRDKLIQVADIQDESIFEGNLLLCKLVGLSIMDTSVGAQILAMCNQKDLGLSVDDF